MGIRDLILISFLVLLNLLLAILSPIEFFQIVQLHLITAIILVLAYPSWASYAIAFILLLVIASIRDATSLEVILVFPTVGFVLSILNLAVPIFKQRPFWLARNLWVILAISILSVISSQTLGGAVGSLLLNLVIINLLTLITRGVKSDKGEISIN